MITYIRDGIAIAGTIALAYGCWQFHPGAGWIAFGAVLLAAVWASLRRKGGDDDTR